LVEFARGAPAVTVDATELGAGGPEPAAQTPVNPHDSPDSRPISGPPDAPCPLKTGPAADPVTAWLAACPLAADDQRRAAVFSIFGGVVG
jgi:hypothetical protein